MQNLDEFFFHSKYASKSETLEILKSAIIQEYIQDLSSQKLLKFSTFPEFLSFSDLTSWVYHKTYSTSTPEAKRLWLLLCNGEESIDEMRFDDFFKRYAELLYEKHQKATNLKRKNQKILKLMRRTNKYIESLDSLLKELGYKLNLQTSHLIDESQKFSFLINVDSLENFDMASMFKDEDYLGHHIELGYKDAVVFTPTETTNGRIVNFRKTQLGLNLDYMTGTIFINIYEDYLRETRIDKTLVARRNLDLFSSLSRGFIVKILLKELRDEVLLKKFTILFEELGLEDDDRPEESGNNFMRGNKQEGVFSKETNCRLLKEEGKLGIMEKQIQNASHNDLLDSEMRMRGERYKLVKTNTSIHNPYVFLKLYISCENLKGLDDLGQYREMMGLRKEFLSHKTDKIVQKICFYKMIIGNMILPLRSVVVSENDIKIDRKFIRGQHFIGGGLSDNSMQQNNKKKCLVF